MLAGNRSFRTLVKQFQERYLKAKKRDKPSVGKHFLSCLFMSAKPSDLAMISTSSLSPRIAAAEVVFLIRKRGGRFLRRLEAPNPGGQVLYYDIGDRHATEKACQALREGAPKLRAKGSRSYSEGTSSDDENKYNASESSSPHKNEKERILTSSSSSFERTVDGKENLAHAQPDDSTHQGTTNCRERTSTNEKPMLIQPSARLLRRAKIEAISVDELPAVEREMYLKDFLPPNPAIPTSEMKPHAAPKPQNYKSDECSLMASV